LEAHGGTVGGAPPKVLFVECPYTKIVWELVAVWSNCANLGLSGCSEVNDLEEWFLTMTKKGTKAVHSLAILTIWQVWKQRNAMTFKEERRSMRAVVTGIKDECSLWASAGGKILQPYNDCKPPMSN